MTWPPGVVSSPVALAARRWPELEDHRPVLLVPLGSCEQHGPHLPLGTDTLVALAVAERVAAIAPDERAVAPPVAYGASGEHAGFPGTLSIGTDALTALLVELVRSADHFDGVVLVNGHGGNRDAVTAAMARVHVEGQGALAWWPGVPGGDAHAGRTETSLVLALAPGDVVVDRISPGRTEPLDELWPALRASGVAAVSPNGVLGDPRGASAAEGERLLAELVRSCSEAIAGWQRGRRPPAARAPRG
ncbi:MAG TPA: mycofactocin biosynthesis peptidyl-dipeptidase MftE [Acidimicrobiales bacterium]|nr:mycofactocin biosynthesis peptidyl-dipeptidase MftE [Acidimicrobiales bacterium]